MVSGHKHKKSRVRFSSKLPYMSPQNRQRLFYYIAKLYVVDKLPLPQIAFKIKIWLKDNLRYSSYSTADPATVGRYLKVAVGYEFLQLNPFSEMHLQNKIEEKFSLGGSSIKINVAPDLDTTFRYLWHDLDNYISNIVNTRNSGDIIFGVSGGHTMLAFAKAARYINDLQWHKKVQKDNRDKLIVCSMTSGGIRSDFTALSDTVALTISDYFECRVSGFLGPAWFSHPPTMRAFREDPDLQKHIELAEKAGIIVTSFGYLADSNSLLRKLFDHAGCSSFVQQNGGVADMLYCCYDGQTGEPVELPEPVNDGLVKAMNLKELQERIEKGETKCFVVAAGKEKGRVALGGILKKRLVSNLYIDRSCAEGLLGI
jgi:DNA-binding transcriptional regulator LsrR (DeoR family)